jgi:hypothetical protein
MLPSSWFRKNDLECHGINITKKVKLHVLMVIKNNPHPCAEALGLLCELGIIGNNRILDE